MQEDTRDRNEEQGDWMPFRLPGGCWVEMPDTWYNN